MKKLFPELNTDHDYKGTTNLPAKAFDPDYLDFDGLKLNTVGVNVDVGIITALLQKLREDNITNAIGSGPLVMRENIISSTMTLSDIESEFNKVYGPIFKTVAKKWMGNNDDKINSSEYQLAQLVLQMDLSAYKKLFVNTANEDKSNELFKEISSDLELDVIINLLKTLIQEQP